MTWDTILGRVLRVQTPSDRKVIYIRVLKMLKEDEQRSTQYVQFTEQNLKWPPTPSSELAERRGTSQDNIRMARMRSKRFFKEHAGAWAAEFSRAIQELWRDDYEEAIGVAVARAARPSGFERYLQDCEDTA